MDIGDTSYTHLGKTALNTARISTVEVIVNLSGISKQRDVYCINRDLKIQVYRKRLTARLRLDVCRWDVISFRLE